MPCRVLATRPSPPENAGKRLLFPSWLCCKRVRVRSRRVKIVFSLSVRLLLSAGERGRRAVTRRDSLSIQLVGLARNISSRSLFPLCDWELLKGRDGSVGRILK